MAERGTEREPGAAPIDPARDATLMKTNDPTALNGGPARHWFRSDAAAEPLPTPLRRAKRPRQGAAASDTQSR